MKRTSRWQDGVTLALGLWLFLSPWILGDRGGSGLNAVLFGAATALVALWGLGGRGSPAPDRTNIALGGWVFFSPWLVGFAGAHAVEAWNAWITGGGIAALSAWGYERNAVESRYAA